MMSTIDTQAPLILVNTAFQTSYEGLSKDAI